MPSTVVPIAVPEFVIVLLLTARIPVLLLPIPTAVPELVIVLPSNARMPN